jgi:predicted phosphate transport protein (TIGR00153 family)
VLCLERWQQDEETTMLMRLMPTEGRFFQLFEDHAQQVVQGSREMAELMANLDDIERRTHSIETLEKRADKIAHATIELLHKTFITPIDRDDIHQLITRMDDILDLIEDCAQSIFLYDVRAVTPDAAHLAQINVACADKVSEAVSLLSNMEHAQRILAICHDIDRLESDADHVMRSAMARLFREEPDVRQVIKLRSIYELLEEMTDRSLDVANIIEGIVIENA